MSRCRQLDEFTVLQANVEFSRLAQVRAADAVTHGANVAFRPGEAPTIPQSKTVILVSLLQSSRRFQALQKNLVPKKVEHR